MKTIIESMQEKSDFICLKPANVEQIKLAERNLRLTFAKDYKEYVKQFGAASFDGHELTGICTAATLNVVHVTEQERISNPDVPGNWYVLEQAHIDGIVIWQDENGYIYQTQPSQANKKIHRSLLDYINSGIT